MGFLTGLYMRFLLELPVTLKSFHFSMYNDSFITQPSLMLYVGCCIAYFSLG